MSNDFLQFRNDTIGFMFKDLDTFKEHEEQKAFLTNAWLMSEPSNRKVCFDAEDALMNGVPDRIILRTLYWRVDKAKRGIQFPEYLKKTKDPNKWTFLKPILAKFWKLSMREIEGHWDLLSPKLDNEKFRQSLADRLMLSNELRKQMGLSSNKPFEIKTKVRGIFG